RAHTPTLPPLLLTPYPPTPTPHPLPTRRSSDLMTMTGMFRVVSSPCNCEKTSHPSKSGRWTSSKMRSGECLRAKSRPSRPCIARSEEHTSELQSLRHLVCRLLLEKKKERQCACR